MQSSAQLYGMMLAALLGAAVASSGTELGTASSASAIQSSTTPVASSQPTATPDLFEVDVIFPRANATYNETEALPIVFSFQGISKARAVGDFWFIWDIMPYGNVGQQLEPGGVLADSWSGNLTAENVITNASAENDTYILVNVTNTRKWRYPPYSHGSVYALQWSIGYYAIYHSCWNESSMDGSLFFTLKDGSTEPDLLTVPACPQLGNIVSLNTSALAPSVTTCVTVATPAPNGNPCGVQIDSSAASSISSVVQNLSAATSTTMSTTSTLSTKNAAAATATPFGSICVAALALGCSLLS